MVSQEHKKGVQVNKILQFYPLKMKASHALSMVRVYSLVFRAMTETDSFKVVSVVCFLGSKKFDILSTFLLL